MYNGDALRGQTGKNQCGSRAKVKGIYGGACQKLLPFNNRDIAFYFNLRSHSRQFIHIFKAVFENGFGHHGIPSGKGQRNGNLRLHIGRKARIRKSLHICRVLLQFTNNPYALIILDNGISHLQKLCRNGLHVLRNHILHKNIPSCHRCGTHKGSRFNLIRNHGIGRSVQATNPFDPYRIRPGSADIRPHTVQEVRYIYNMRLFRYVLHNGASLRKNCRKHDIDCCADRDDIQINMASNQTIFRFRNQIAVLYLRPSTEGTETL